jgi:hypothetical protein
VIFIALLALAFVFWAIASFIGLVIGGLAALNSRRIKKLDGTFKPEDLLIQGEDWKNNLDGWDGAEELDIDEDL